MKPIILNEIIDGHKEKIREVILRESVAPTEHLKMYDKYQFLITGKAERDIDEFLFQSQNYERLIEEIRKYQKLGEEIQYTSQKVIACFSMTLDGREWSVSGVVTSSVRAHSDKTRSAVNRSMCPELVTLASMAWVSVSSS